MAQDDRGTIASLEAARQVFRASIQAHQGRVIDMAGDSVLAVFDTAASAVSAALEVQASLQTDSARVAQDRRMQFRIGVHMGDITEMPDGSVYGEGVNMAARLEGLALPGGITVSDAVRSSVRNRVAGVFEDLGEKQVKNFDDPVRAFRVRPKSAGISEGWLPKRLQVFTSVLHSPSRWWALAIAFILVVATALVFAWPHRSSHKDEPPLLSVAVLPFGVSEGPGNAELAQALALELTRRLGQTVLGHPVKSAAAVQAFRGDLHDSDAVGRDLDVRYIVRGDVTRDGSNVFVTPELVEARTRIQVWTARFEAPGDRPDDAVKLLALRILSQLRPALYEAQAKSLPKTASSDASALELAFRGQFVQSSLDYKTQIETSTEECDAALRLDPALALALLCKTWVAEMLLFGNDWTVVGKLDSKRLAEMDDLSARAVAMDRSDADVWNVRANVLRYQRRWDAVVQARSRALELNPALVDAYVESARDLIRMAQPEKAVAVLSKAAEVDPGVTEQDDFLLVRCRAYLGFGEYDKAVESCGKFAGGSLGRIGSQVLPAIAYAQAGQIDKAIAARDRAIAEQRGLTISSWRANAVVPGDLPAYVEQLDRYIVPGMRKAGFPEK